MCGIVGIRRTDREPVDRETLLRMATTLRHRGPDAMGSWVDGPVGLAHTRLSIIDLQGSQQPMSSPSGRRHLVFNGEILNYRELRAEISYCIKRKATPRSFLPSTKDMVPLESRTYADNSPMPHPRLRDGRLTPLSRSHRHSPALLLFGCPGNSIRLGNQGAAPGYQ